jgi:hypothetical protein
MENPIMKEHYTEADLLETYYTQPGESMPVMMHLASCTDCASKYQRLDRKLREAAACHIERPETFWAVQRGNIMRKIGAQRAEVAPAMRIAAATLLAVILGGVIAYRSTQQDEVFIPTLPEIQQVEVEQMPADPWQSEELKEFQTMVEWESWIAEPAKKNGDHS